MERCKSCGAEIKWIKMMSGRVMPCDPEPISYDTVFPVRKGALTLITPEGKIASGVFNPGSKKIGYTSHFATCPNANQNRKRGGNEEGH